MHVPQGFEYKMRFVYAHFPINVTITGKKNKVEIRNFLGEKVVRTVDAYEGVEVTRSNDVKDEIVLIGNDIENVSKTWCASLVAAASAARRGHWHQPRGAAIVAITAPCVVGLQLMCLCDLSRPFCLCGAQCSDPADLRREAQGYP